MDGAAIIEKFIQSELESGVLKIHIGFVNYR